MRGLTLLQDGIPINLADDNGDFQELDPQVFAGLPPLSEPVDLPPDKVVREAVKAAGAKAVRKAKVKAVRVKAASANRAAEAAAKCDPFDENRPAVCTASAPLDPLQRE